MSNRNFRLGLLSLFALLYACTHDFIEANLTGKKVAQTSPGDNVHSTALSTVFYWQKVDGVLKYNLQVAKPSFSGMQQLLLDTNVASDHFAFSLTPGTYQWRVKGTNGSSQTDYSTRTLIIDSTASLVGQTVILISPAAGYLTNSTAAILFKWDSLSIATDYRFQLSNDSTGALLVDISLAATSYTYTPAQGKYTWKVRAQNATSNTLYSSRSFTVDLTAPPVSIQSSPKDGDTVGSPDTLKWTRSASVVTDSLFVYPDSLVSAPLVRINSANTSYIFTGTANKKYYWRLRSGSAAGNWSSYSSLRKFFVK